MQRLIEHGRGVPLGREAPRRLESNGDAGKRAEFFLDDAAPFLNLRRFVNVRGRWLRSGWNRGKMAFGKLYRFVRIDIPEN
jgi:hypothetical protein